MTVGELIAELSKLDVDMEVLSGDNDSWFYGIGVVDIGYVKDGRIVEKNRAGAKCVLLRP